LVLLRHENAEMIAPDFVKAVDQRQKQQLPRRPVT
jgi:hypothetical protein